MFSDTSFRLRFPFLFGGTFIEGTSAPQPNPRISHFPSFSEGLSLRVHGEGLNPETVSRFPSFSEGLSLRDFSDGLRPNWSVFPFLFGGTFIEGMMSLPNH